MQALKKFIGKMIEISARLFIILHGNCKAKRGRGGRVENVSAYYAGGLPIESRQPTSVTNVACREWDQLPCRIHSYTVYTPIGGKGRCHTSCDLQDHSTQARKSAGEISTLALKPMRKDPQEQSVAPQIGPWSRQKLKKKKRGSNRAVHL